ncbi:unnamed protein product [Closterium sp. Yama58-4]|nr:unnamed protein product [Closterium sp. Yama58-4]
MSSTPSHPLASFSSRDSAPANPLQPSVRELYGVGRGPGSGSVRAPSSGPGSESASAQQPVGLATQGAHLAGGSPGLAARGIAGSAKTGSGTISVADNGGDDVERWREAVQGLRDAESLVGALEQLLLGPDTLFLDANAMRSARSVYEGQRQLHALNRRVAGLQGELDAAVEAAREARAGRRESEEERRRMQDALAQAQRDMEATSGVFDLYTSELRGRQQQLERAEEEVRNLQARLRAVPSHPATSAHSSPQSASHSSASATSSISYSSAYGSVHSSAYASAASSVYGSAIDVPASPALATGAAPEIITATSTTDHSVLASPSPLSMPSQTHASVHSPLVEAEQQVAGVVERTGAGAVDALGGRQGEDEREMRNGREEEGQEMGTVGVSDGSGRVASQAEGTGTSNTEGDDDEFVDSLQ